MKLRYRVEVFEDPEEPGVWLARVPSVAGVFSDGDSREEALANVQEALEGMLEAMRQWGEPIPPSDFEDFVELEIPEPHAA
ncbi:MAG: type II toxin-antitoxin system HicB family antitoxin [Meiothermus sp.]|uniref:type II toxin-antitoxin system HicB family antitoxin n=1 Tax=unclassified Meiothermus TaxID=370471 RepID=UPI001AA04C50|nr:MULTISPECIES: type II toxin-antitoxin system HicB family antitoxin [unclassified Meiothermus]MBO1436967.1 type II toxin-antitoxin system HicB family antitoxin [Meiothermus sp. CFH 77666]MCS7069128.1 type II toxin-antitoxin system HicB family antitoxin [Meiothermus sp.]MDW8426531.1 type II toxin-antitoxin system HicB family antitoxin [Meiothermus sp.]